MKYIIMCGGNYKHWEKPRHLSKIFGEELVARTIRLLKENGINDIAISSNNPIFEKFNIPILKHNNLYIAKGWEIEQGSWFNCFFPTNEPVCYIFGDVYFSEKAIKTIVETKTNDIEFFGSKPPFAYNYIKDHEEPFALKVVNTKHLKEAIQKTKELEKQGKFWRQPIMWELWTVIKNAPLQTKPDEYTAEYTVINDYTVDIDFEEDIIKLENILKGEIKMVKCEVIKEFTLGEFDKLKNITRKKKEEKGRLFEGDTFECTNEMAEYLSGQNMKGKKVVEIIEVIPEKKEEQKEEKKPVKKTTKKKTDNKKGETKNGKQ